MYQKIKFMAILMVLSLNSLFSQNIIRTTSDHPEGEEIYSIQSPTHNENIHQYIVKEAFQLLKFSYPTELTEMENYVGTTESSSTGLIRTFGPWKIVAGAYMEDHADIVYHYGIGARPDFNQSLPIGFMDFILESLGVADIDDAFHSITHFWNADAGYNDQTFLNGTYSGIYWSFSCENAMQKIAKFRDGTFPARVIYREAATLPDTYIISGGYDFEYNSLKDLYLNGNAIITKYIGLDNDWHNIYYPIQWGPTARKAFAYEILGRMIHLLGDMAVPAHVHEDSHPPTDSDTYETLYNEYNLWTAEEVYSQYGYYLDPYVYSDPLYYIMYYMNQISDHFASDDKNGDDSYQNDGPFSVLSLIIPNLSSVPTNKDQINHDNVLIMHNEIFPHVIKAAAGLLYWFAVETGQIVISEPIALTISGPTWLDNYEYGTFTANPSGGSGSYVDYKWWSRNDEGIITPLSLTGGVEPNAPLPGLWNQVSSWDGLSTVTPGYNWDFSLKCEVTDS
ncbi:MAG: hypothetical protein AB7T22_08470, partial [Calditrichaceae bacterium]